LVALPAVTPVQRDSCCSWVNMCRKMPVDANRAMWVDMLMLAKADCLIMSHSGYSLVAQIMSSARCVVWMSDCLSADDARFEGMGVV
jgi:hypothetical protein